MRLDLWEPKAEMFAFIAIRPSRRIDVTRTIEPTGRINMLLSFLACSRAMVEVSCLP
jgi:hypothetical protein